MKPTATPHSSKRRRLLRFTGLVVSLALILLLAALSRAQVERTASGVHQRLLLPLGRKSIGIPIYAGTGEHVLIPNHLDGPVIRTTATGTWNATWFCEDRVQHAAGRTKQAVLACAGTRRTFVLDPVTTPTAIGPMPARLVVLSDIEGNHAFMQAALNKLGVVDAAGRWTYAQGQLVILGDAMDRGRDVFAVLWHLRTLSMQARGAGGAVHLVLGNHEQYALLGNISRADPEHRYALKAMGGATAVLGADTMIGAWLREQPVALRLGRVLFVHGGISTDVLDTGLGIEALNCAMRQSWRLGKHTSPTRRAALFGLSGITRYRGYFGASEGSGQAATQAQIDRTLAHFDVDQIVVAHTLVDRVQSLHGGRVMAIDVNDQQAARQVLVYQDGVPTVVDIGIARGLPEQDKSATTRRRFNLSDQEDWRLLADMVQAFWALSRIPAAT